MEKLGDVTIFYQGGSGGFALYYYFLLSGKYHTGIDKTNYQDLIKSQFSLDLIKHPTTWKHTEVWPNNLQCKSSHDSPRLFLICNPCWNADMIKQNLLISDDTYKILLYTDLKLQLRMAYEKRAYWFTKISKNHFNAPASEQKYIREIISSSDNGFDPKLKEVRNTFNVDLELRLEDFVQTGLVAGFDNPNADQIEFLKYWKKLQPSKANRLLER
jgi:hypothetical protein